VLLAYHLTSLSGRLAPASASPASSDFESTLSGTLLFAQPDANSELEVSLIPKVDEKPLAGPLGTATKKVSAKGRVGCKS